MLKVSGLVLALFALVCFAQPGWAKDAKAPKAVVSEKEYDFKEVKEGEVLEHTFKIKNEGSAPLNILEVKTG